MSERRVARALARLAAPGAVLALDRGGPTYGVFVKRDRRQRPALRLGADEVRRLEAEGAIEAEGDGFVLSAAGAARVARESATPGEAFIAQHIAVVTRDVVDADGAFRRVRGFDPEGPMRRACSATWAEWRLVAQHS
jgi:hypothetical protein